jgi:hypothetical protein
MMCPDDENSSTKRESGYPHPPCYSSPRDMKLVKGSRAFNQLQPEKRRSLRKVALVRNRLLRSSVTHLNIAPVLVVTDYLSAKFELGAAPTATFNPSSSIPKSYHHWTYE